MAIDRETLRYLGWWGAFGVLMCLLPLVVGTGTLRILIFAHFLGMFAMSWTSSRAGPATSASATPSSSASRATLRRS